MTSRIGFQEATTRDSNHDQSFEKAETGDEGERALPKIKSLSREKPTEPSFSA